MKIPESSWVVNSYNDCGFRTHESCGQKPHEALRVAVLGTSFSYGYMNAYEDAYTSRAAAELSRQCGRPVEFQNLGVPNLNLLGIYRRMDEALRLKPDLVLLSLTAMDFRVDLDPNLLAHRDQPLARVQDTVPVGRPDWLKRVVVEPLKESRTIYMLQHFLYQNPSTYIDLYLLHGDSVGYLRTSPSPTWKQRFADFNVILGALEQKAQAAHVPLALVLGPVPSQVALENIPPREGLDALAFDHQLSRIASEHNIHTIDALPEMRDIRHPMSLFYVVDGHLGGAGQKILARVLDTELRSGEFASFAGCNAHPAKDPSQRNGN